MKAVLYICHGSRIREANEQAISFIQQIMKRVDMPIQEISFLLNWRKQQLPGGFEKPCRQKRSHGDSFCHPHSPF